MPCRESGTGWGQRRAVRGAGRLPGGDAGAAPVAASLIGGALLAFKVALFAAVGPEAYAERVARLSVGAAALRCVGTAVMRADPVTLVLGGALRGGAR